MVEWINQGGVIMWLIIAGGFIAMLIFIERLFHLHRAQINIGEFLDGITMNLTRGNDLEAIAICDQTPGPAAHLVRTALLHRTEDRGSIAESLRMAGIREVPRLERHTNMLITLAQVLPMLGLLGTVLGLLDMLQALQLGSPLVEVGSLSRGLWISLMTTAAGLITGIPAYAGYHFLINRVESITVDMEQAASEMIQFLSTTNQESDHES